MLPFQIEEASRRVENQEDEEKEAVVAKKGEESKEGTKTSAFVG
jgi:hypothetical protein